MSEKISITVDTAVAEALRQVAADRDTTVDQLIHSALLSLVRDARSKADRLNHLQQMFHAARRPMPRTGTR